MIDHARILDQLSIGAAVIDSELKVLFWNRWMSEHSLLDRQAVLDRPIQELLPGLADKGFDRKAREVFRRGRPGFFNKKLHRHVFPFYSCRSYLENKLLPMEQTVILSPLPDPDGKTGRLLVSVFDISDWVAKQDELLRSRSELQQLSLTDELTQAPNRRSVMERLASELSLHIRKRRPLALALLDIDHFKEVNDNFGHQVGDVILREMVQLLRERLRSYDSLGHYGGEEFLLILPETTPGQAFLVCDRLRRTVAEEEFLINGHSHRITVSLGVTGKGEEESPSREGLIAKADRYLYQAKEAGRNRTIVGTC